jgi:hypothetical protein
MKKPVILSLSKDQPPENSLTTGDVPKSITSSFFFAQAS